MLVNIFIWLYIMILCKWYTFDTYLLLKIIRPLSIATSSDCYLGITLDYKFWCKDVSTLCRIFFLPTIFYSLGNFKINRVLRRIWKNGNFFLIDSLYFIHKYKTLVILWASCGSNCFFLSRRGVLNKCTIWYRFFFLT